MLRNREALALGKRGRYRPLQLISEDPIGSLWLAEDVALGVEVTVRVLRKELAAHERFRRVLRAELRRVLPLKHQHIANVISYSVAERPSEFFVLRALRGESLASRILRKGRLDPSEAGSIASQVELALDAAHAIDIVHGGLTHHSVLLTSTGGVKVIDFGIPTALRLVARDAPRLVMDAANDRERTDLVVDRSYDARSLELLKRRMLSGKGEDPDGELPVLLDLVLAASSGTAGQPRRPVRELPRFHAGRLLRRFPSIVSKGSKSRRPRLGGPDRSRLGRRVMSEISSWATGVWRAVSASGRRIRASLVGAARAVASAPARVARSLGSLVARSGRRVARLLVDGARAIVSVPAEGMRAAGRVLVSTRGRIGRRVTRSSAAPSAHSAGTLAGRAPGSTKAQMLAGATLVAIIATAAAITLLDGSRSRVVRPDRFEAATASESGVAPWSATGVIMPDVRQLTAMQASKLLGRAGLVVVDSKPMPGTPGEVVGTDPAQSRLVAPGAEIVLLVGASPDRLEQES